VLVGENSQAMRRLGPRSRHRGALCGREKGFVLNGLSREQKRGLKALG